MAREHVLDSSNVHHHWDNAIEPTLVIDPGDTVHFELLMAGEGQVRQGDAVEDTAFDFETMYNLDGPVFVEGAEPGDTLEIEILSLEPGAWGWTVILPEFGLLPADFPDGYLKTWDLTTGGRARLTDGVSVPLAPFLGTMGTAPPDPGVHPPFPPHRGGGNLDNRHLVAGATLWLPVWNRGALFSCGDPHAAQGDGEVCVSAIECPMQATLRFRLHKTSLPAPSFRVPAEARPPGDRDAYHATMGLGPDLMDCARDAVRGMIAWLGREHELSREDAYVLCSVAGDLRIHEVVDAGVWNVGLTLPLGVFD